MEKYGKEMRAAVYLGPEKIAYCSDSGQKRLRLSSAATAAPMKTYRRGIPNSHRHLSLVMSLGEIL
jgi:hypothetical protein